MPVRSIQIQTGVRVALAYALFAVAFAVTLPGCEESPPAPVRTGARKEVQAVQSADFASLFAEGVRKEVAGQEEAVEVGPFMVTWTTAIHIPTIPGHGPPEYHGAFLLTVTLPEDYKGPSTNAVRYAALVDSDGNTYRKLRSIQQKKIGSGESTTVGITTTELLKSAKWFHLRLVLADAHPLIFEVQPSDIQNLID